MMQIEEAPDPLYFWKKHSGFKKGLLTDIVMGDERTGQRVQSSTMHADFIKLTPRALQPAGKPVS
jgi:hypothetical protein